MKILFGINITNSRKEPEIWGDELVAQALPPVQAEALTKETDKLENREEYMKLPKALRWVKNIAMIAALAILGGTIRALVDTPLSEAFQNAAWVFYIMLGCGLIWGVLELAQWARKKRLGSKEDLKAQQARVQSMIQNAYATLGVPADAANVDVLVSRFKVKGERIFLKGFLTNTFINPELRAFAQDGFLYLVDGKQKYAIPLADITGFDKINRRVSISSWNKEQYITEEPYKSHKMGETRYGISFKPYYALEFRHEGESWRLYIPPYELATFEYLIGKEARQGLFS